METVEFTYNHIPYTECSEVPVLYFYEWDPICIVQLTSSSKRLFISYNSLTAHSIPEINQIMHMNSQTLSETSVSSLDSIIGK